jgi:Effector Associated Constant Component 1
MEILLSVGTADATESLSTWLSESFPLPGCIRHVSIMPTPGAQGPGSDALAVALGSGGSITTLALCLRTWIQQYFAQRSTAVHVELIGEDGTKATIDAASADEAERILRQVLKDGQQD